MSTQTATKVFLFASIVFTVGWVSRTSFSDFCYNTFRHRPDAYGTENIMFGADKIDATTNIVLSNGALDPWRCGGVDRNLSASIVVIPHIAGAAHHLDLRAPSTFDPPAVVAARREIASVMRQWLH
eukprot:m.195668 g.195668  ORF g.195668 m.195668 type:complete len:126 (+) comp18682_c0_seq2:1994-2371(+)